MRNNQRIFDVDCYPGCRCRTNVVIRCYDNLPLDHGRIEGACWNSVTLRFALNQILVKFCIITPPPEQAGVVLLGINNYMAFNPVLPAKGILISAFSFNSCVKLCNSPETIGSTADAISANAWLYSNLAFALSIRA